MKTNVILCSALLLGACALDQEDGELDEEIPLAERLSANALTPTQLSTASLSSAILTQTSIDTMASTVSGRAALPYVVGCALATGNNPGCR